MSSALPVEKSLRIMEILQQEPSRRFTLTEVSRETGVAVSTARRILGILREHGYLFRRADKSYTVNFLLRKTLPMDPGIYGRLLEVLEQAAAESGQSAEILSVQDEQLYWHEKTTAASQKIRIAAEAGFRRTLYELDAPSRLYLHCIGIDAVEQQFNTDRFYLSGPEYRRIAWEEARRCIEDTEIRKIAFDYEGNSNGVRRFAGLFRAGTEKGKEQLICIICIAEAAIPIHNREEHIQDTIQVLQTALSRMKELVP